MERLLMAGVFILAVLVLICGTAIPVESETPMPNPIPTVIPTGTPTPSRVQPWDISTPLPLPKVTPTITPVPLASDAVEITAGIKIGRCEKYLGIVDRLMEDEQYQNTIDSTLVLSVAAQESGCVPYLVSDDGHSSVGLMQIVPRSWTPEPFELKNPYINLKYGAYLLDRAISLADGDVKLGLAYYNCGEVGVESNACGSYGGLNYAENVLQFWYPRVQRQLDIKN